MADPESLLWSPPCTRSQDCELLSSDARHSNSSGAASLQQQVARSLPWQPLGPILDLPGSAFTASPGYSTFSTPSAVATVTAEATGSRPGKEAQLFRELFLEMSTDDVEQELCAFTLETVAVAQDSSERKANQKKIPSSLFRCVSCGHQQ